MTFERVKFPNNLIYIAGPYSAETPEDVLRNVNLAIDAWLHLYSNGWTPICPHLSHFIHERNNATHCIDFITYEKWLEYDEKLLAMCDSVALLSRSSGADKEVAFAQEHGIIVYFELSDVPSLTKPSLVENARNAIDLNRHFLTIHSKITDLEAEIEHILDEILSLKKRLVKLEECPLQEA